MHQCPSCGGCCHKSGCQRLNTNDPAYKAMSEVTDQALAWRVEVRKIDPVTEWKPYATYDSEKTAMGMVGRCIGHPLEFRVIPLYALRHNAGDKPPQVGLD